MIKEKDKGKVEKREDQKIKKKKNRDLQHCQFLSPAINIAFAKNNNNLLKTVMNSYCWTKESGVKLLELFSGFSFSTRSLDQALDAVYMEAFVVLAFHVVFLFSTEFSEIKD